MIPVISIFGDIAKHFDSVSTSYFGDLDLVDKTRYDIIEKPEWKKKRLENAIASCKSKIDFYQAQADNYLQQKQNAENELKKLESELAQLK